MFDNEFTDEGQPICPACKKVIVPDQGKTSNAYKTPKNGLLLMHNICAEQMNTLAQMGFFG